MFVKSDTSSQGLCMVVLPIFICLLHHIRHLIWSIGYMYGCLTYLYMFVIVRHLIWGTCMANLPIFIYLLLSDTSSEVQYGCLTYLYVFVTSDTSSEVCVWLTYLSLCVCYRHTPSTRIPHQTDILCHTFYTSLPSSGAHLERKPN